MSFPRGSLVRLEATFTSKKTGRKVDPTTVVAIVTRPSGADTTYTSPDVVRDAEGEYHYDINADTGGPWFWRWESTGTGQAALNGHFHVDN